MKFKESAIAHKYLDGLEGIEIGAAAHNPFGLNCKNVDYTDSLDTVFKKGEIILCGETAKVDIVAEGDDLPLEDKSVDYVISSHVIEHFYDPVKAMKEWARVARKYILIICPHAYRIPDEKRPITELSEIIARHEGDKPKPNLEGGHNISAVSGLPLYDRGHYSVWDTEAFLKVCKHYGFKVVESLDADDKVGNGFLVIIEL